MTTSRDPRSSTAAAPNSQANYQPASRQQTPSQSYFSASPSPSPPPSTPPSPPPITQSRIVPFISRVMASDSRRREYVRIALQQFDIQTSACTNGQPVPPFDCSCLNVDDFKQESSNEDAIERFCVWDWVDDPNIVHTRMAMAEFEQKQEADAKTEG